MADDAPDRAPGKTTLRAFEVIYAAIRKDLQHGTLKAGDKLPAEREFAEQLGVSRTAVREALRALEADGIIQLQKGVSGGAFIQPGNRDTVNRSINDIIVLGKIPLRQVMDVRSLLLSHAVKLMCDRSTTEELDTIEKNIFDTEVAVNEKRKLKRYVAEFYSLIGKYSGNEVLEILIEATTSIALDFVWQHRIEFTSELITYRRTVLARLRARDAEGAQRAVAESIAFLHGFVIARAAQT
jgi:GntR family transcriptional repressor for pyruvate dehydrogenase complex